MTAEGASGSRPARRGGTLASTLLGGTGRNQRRETPRGDDDPETDAEDSRGSSVHRTARICLCWDVADAPTATFLRAARAATSGRG